MKKITFMLFCALAMLIGFSACSSDDNGDNVQMTNQLRFHYCGWQQYHQ